MSCLSVYNALIGKKNVLYITINAKKRYYHVFMNERLKIVGFGSCKDRTCNIMYDGTTCFSVNLIA